MDLDDGMGDIDIGMGDQELDPMIKDPGTFSFGGDDDGLGMNLDSTSKAFETFVRQLHSACISISNLFCNF